MSATVFAPFGHPFFHMCRAVACAVLVMLAVSPAVCARAGRAGVPTIALSATRYAALNDGRDSLEVLAEVRDSTGRYAVDGTTVTFTTNLGVFAQDGATTRATTRSGTARVRMTSEQKGTATVTAAVQGGGFQKLEVLFTDDPADTFQGNVFVTIEATGSLIYAAGERTIEATSRPAADHEETQQAGVEVRFRNIVVRATRLQVDCTSNTVRASGDVVVARGKQTLRCAKLNYALFSGVGYAVAEEGRTLKPVKISGHALDVEPVDIGIAPKFFEMKDLADAKLVIVARHIVLFPGDKLQFKRPRFYEDGQHLFTLAFYSLSLYSSQLFTDQFLSLGTQGVGLDVPLYYDLTPESKGVFRVKYGERYGSSFARRPGWALDLMQAYNSSSGPARYTGEFGLTGFNRSDWGFRWNHSHEFSSDTRTSLYVDFPQHRSVYGSGHLSQQLGGFHLGLNAAANRSLTGFSASGTRADAYLETTPRRVGGSRVMYALGANASTSETLSGEQRYHSVSEGVRARLFAGPIQLDRLTSVTNSLSVGHIWTNPGRSGTVMLATVSANRVLGGNRSLQATYDYVHQPLSVSDGDHRLSLSFGASEARWAVFFYNTLMVDTGASSLIGDMQYALGPRWRMSLGATAQRYAGTDYTDLMFGIAHNIGGRDIVLSYSTYNRRIMLDLEASRF